jgi:hypothetical protein
MSERLLLWRLELIIREETKRETHTLRLERRCKCAKPSFHRYAHCKDEQEENTSNKQL